MKNFKSQLGKVVKVCNWFSVPLQFLGVCILYLIIEAICRHLSLYEAVQFMTGSKLYFCTMLFLIFVTTTVGLSDEKEDICGQ